MDLIEICEPIFLEVCAFNRVAAIAPRAYDFRQTLRSSFQQAEIRAGDYPVVASQFERVKKPLVYFIDDYVLNSPLFLGEERNSGPHPLVASWRDSILEDEIFHSVVGGRMFFKELDDLLVDPNLDARERLLVFRTCLGLGFGGLYREEPTKLEEYQTKIRLRLRKLGYAENEDPNAEVCPGAASPLNQPLFMRRVPWLKWVVAGFTIFAVGIFVFYWVQFKEGKGALTDLLERINSQ